MFESLSPFQFGTSIFDLSAVFSRVLPRRRHCDHTTSSLCSTLVRVADVYGISHQLWNDKLHVADGPVISLSDSLTQRLSGVTSV